MFFDRPSLGIFAYELSHTEAACLCSGAAHTSERLRNSGWLRIGIRRHWATTDGGAAKQFHTMAHCGGWAGGISRTPARGEVTPPPQTRNLPPSRVRSPECQHLQPNLGGVCRDLLGNCTVFRWGISPATDNLAWAMLTENYHSNFPRSVSRIFRSLSLTKLSEPNCHPYCRKPETKECLKLANISLP